MQQITGRDAALAVLNPPSFVVPPVPPAPAGVVWLRATVGRFSTGEAHKRRRALSVALLNTIPRQSLRAGRLMHPVALLAREMGVGESVVDLVRDVAQAYQPGTGDQARADAAVGRLVAVFGGRYDEPTAARVGVLVQACEATAVLIERAGFTSPTSSSASRSSTSGGFDAGSRSGLRGTALVSVITWSLPESITTQNRATSLTRRI